MAVAPNGTLVMCDKFGFVWHAEEAVKKGSGGSSFSPPSRIAHLGPGRPLGFHHDAAGNLLVCMAGGGGLVRLDARSGRVEVLAAVAHATESHEEVGKRAQPGGQKERETGLMTPILYANDLDIDHVTGAVYFTDSAAIQPVRGAGGFSDTLRAYLLSLFQGGKTGRLLKWDPATGLATVVASGLAYANGVALLPPEKEGRAASHAAVVETNAMRVVKVGLTGSEAGEVSPFLTTGLPGFPDGLSRGQDGRSLWLALVAPPSPLAPHLRPRVVRFLAAWAPRPPLGKWGAVVRVDGQTGAVLDSLFDLGGLRVSSTSAVTEDRAGRLWLGNLNGASVSVLEEEKGGGVEGQEEERRSRDEL